ncbi:hypothetical protein RIR_jg1352.t1 [Rhizophagus irregularis DAOM 181602=DAOM 197198]|nr:hypothetical protein RIR_jg1352.t1 [Rhizophagus irregularis DAOM 181602=DAOM 197198]
MARIIWYTKEKSFINKSKKTKVSLNIYNELNDDINDDDVSDEDNMDVDELMNDLGEISARIIDDINVFESNNNSEPPTLLEIFNGQFNPQLIETAIENIKILKLPTTIQHHLGYLLLHYQYQKTIFSLNSQSTSSDNRQELHYYV